MREVCWDEVQPRSSTSSHSSHAATAILVRENHPRWEILGTSIVIRMWYSRFVRVIEKDAMLRKAICSGHPNICHTVAYHYSSRFRMTGIRFGICVKFSADASPILQHFKLIGMTKVQSFCQKTLPFPKVEILVGIVKQSKWAGAPVMGK